jgi:NitT/TauT family transport system ATP-binding protein
VSFKLQLLNLDKVYYNESGQLPVLHQLRLEVMAGEFLCIVGASGSGKSTLLRLIAGFETADGGEIRLEGKQVTAPGVNRMMIFQDFNQLFPWKTVLGNVIYPLKVNRIGRTETERKERALNSLRLARLEGFEYYYPHQLSGGMKQKAAIARALALNPEILLMDEPFSSLDPQTRTALQENLLEVWQRIGITIIFVTHDLPEAILLADRIAVLDLRRHNIGAILTNEMPRPRRADNPEFSVMQQKVFSLLEQ